MTSAHPSRPTRLPQALFAVLAGLTLCAAFAGTALAAPGTGKVTLTVKMQGLKAAYSAKAGKTGSAKRPKGKRGGGLQTAVLPVSALEVGSSASVSTEGGLTFSAGSRRATLTGLTARALPRGTAVTATLGGGEIVFFRSKTRPAVDTLTVKLSGAKLSLTGRGARALRHRLGLDELSGGPLGSLSIDAAVIPEPAKAAEMPGKTDEDQKPAPGGEPYPYEEQCPVPKVEGGSGFGDPPAEVVGTAPLPAFNAGTSQEVTGTSVEWGFKDSFRAYVTGGSGSLQTLDGATANPAGPTMATPGSYFGFPVATGTYEAGSAPNHSGDRLVADGTGTVLLCKSEHGFNIALRNPTVVIDGAASRIVADVGSDINGTWYPYQRADIGELDLSSVTPQIADGGSTIAWEDVPVTVSADGALALGIYQEGEALDTITVKTTLKRPLLTQCGIDAGSGAPPAVNFAQTALPALDSPVTGSGGTINWGFRRATRNTTVLPVPGGGSFQLLSGATEGFPGNMGGSAGAPPAGGNGKFFRFPVSSYSYDPGGAGGADDRLVATSEATVGFCIPNAGNFGIVISKPTLVVDGAASRLIANAYSYRGPSAGWIGGRVTLVNLDASAVPATATATDVTWGDVTADDTALDTGIPVTGGFATNALALASGLGEGAGSGGFDPVAARIALPTP